MLNTITIMGRLVGDPVLRATGTGASVTSFTVAVDRDFKGKDGNKVTDFIDVVAWKHTAEFVCKYMGKGRMIVVDGNLQTRNYEDKQGNKRKATEIVASSVYFADSKNDSDVTRNSNTIEISHDTEDFAEVENDDLPF